MALPAALFLAMLLATPAKGDEPSEEPEADLLHSDLPIFKPGGEDAWPQHFQDDDGTFGCTSRVAFGDWEFRRTDAEDDDDVSWYRFTNYGVFHCWANTIRADERPKLDAADFFPSFFIFLGKASVKGRDLELWAIQIGARPGSEYQLLSRSPAPGLIKNFDVLQTACPRENVRNAGSLDILITRYCAVNSRSELTRLARRMARLRPLGILTQKSDAEEQQEGRQ